MQTQASVRSQTCANAKAHAYTVHNIISKNLDRFICLLLLSDKREAECMKILCCFAVKTLSKSCTLIGVYSIKPRSPLLKMLCISIIINYAILYNMSCLYDRTISVFVLTPILEQKCISMNTTYGSTNVMSRMLYVL